MARYIDADKLIEKYERVIKDPWNKSSAPSSWASAWECVIADIDDIPTADVVPKSEVERLQAEKDALIKNYAECMKDYAREIFAEIEKLHLHITNEFDLRRYNELKKKYTEGEDKPASEEKYFSPEDVSKMTPQEVREKYTAIRRSMERW